MFAGVDVQAEPRQRVVIGIRIAEPHLVQPNRDGRDGRAFSAGGSSLCTSGMPRNRSNTRDSAHQPTNDTPMIANTELPSRSHGQ